MRYLRIESTKFTPGIVLDPSHFVLEFYGFSLPENAIEFYQPVFHWMSELKKSLEAKLPSEQEVSVIFKLVYFNSSSLRQLVEIFQILGEMHHLGIPVQITWQYDSEDPSMADSGKEFGEIAKVPVNLVAYN